MKVKAPGFRIRSSTHVTFSPDGAQLAVVGRDVVLWDVSTRQRLRSSRLLSNPAGVAFSPDGLQFVVKNTRGELLCCETATADPIARFLPQGRDEGASPVYASNDLIIDGSWNGEIRAREPANLSPRVLWRGGHQSVGQVLRSLNGWAFNVRAKHGHPSFGSDAGGDQILIGKTPDEKPLRPLNRAWRFLRGAALSHAGERIAVRHGTTQRVVEIIDLATERLIASATSEFGGTGYGLAWAPDGSVLVLVEKGGFSFRDSTSLTETAWLPSEYPADVSFSPDGRLIALGDWGKGFVAPWPALVAELTSSRSQASSASVA